MKQHKPTEKEFDDLHAMLRLIDEYLEHGSIDERLEDDTSYDPDSDDGPPEMPAEQFVERLRAAHKAGGFRWQAVLWAGDTAIRNSCDPTAKVLEWRKELKLIGDTLEPSG